MAVEKDKLIPGRRIQIVFGIMALLMVLLLAGVAWVVTDIRDLTKQNKALIVQIQVSRVETCKSIYAGIEKVFQPFFPPEPRSERQQKDLDKFTKIIDDETAKCVEITKIEKPKEKKSDGG